ncbi:3'(2'),5'-bisphosphate nucleotidase CysQ [Humitalea sp. 24SJ18S-53]|uniref:3'(2'),5'-bisphosphate nucleotidase CysQ n=1 Tax=Humitalea sp. 24SJ18S-53 TaxID=3422307 RepID=UPI003D67AF40
MGGEKKARGAPPEAAGLRHDGRMNAKPDSDQTLAARLLPALERIAVAAGRRIMQVYAQGAAAQDRKADGSPVTEADLAAEAIILAGLAEAAPGIPVVSEEDGGGTAPRPAPEATFFMVDPLDGTREFLGRTDEFTVNIALIAAGRPVAGVVFAPALGLLWSGALGHGATLRADGQAPRPIAARPRPTGGLVAVVSRSHHDAQTEAFLARLPVIARRAIGSSLKFCLVAQGEADVYPRFGPTMEWDTAAGQAVLEAAGGRVTDPDGAPFRCGKRDAGYRNRAFVAWGA